MKPSELLRDPESWCQGAEARNENGDFVKCYTVDAVAWCLIGALVKCSLDEAIAGRGGIKNAMLALERRLFRQGQGGAHCSCSTWNDMPGRTWEEVVGLLKEEGL